MQLKHGQHVCCYCTISPRSRHYSKIILYTNINMGCFNQNLSIKEKYKIHDTTYLSTVVPLIYSITVYNSIFFFYDPILRYFHRRRLSETQDLSLQHQITDKGAGRANFGPREREPIGSGQ